MNILTVFAMHQITKYLFQRLKGLTFEFVLFSQYSRWEIKTNILKVKGGVEYVARDANVDFDNLSFLMIISSPNLIKPKKIFTR